MKPFIFSADAHVREPNSLFLDGLPASLKPYAVRTVKEGDALITRTEEKVIFKLSRMTPNKTTRGGKVQIADSINFPISKTVAAAP